MLVRLVVVSAPRGGMSFAASKKAVSIPVISRGERLALVFIVFF